MDLRHLQTLSVPMVMLLFLSFAGCFSEQKSSGSRGLRITSPDGRHDGLLLRTNVDEWREIKLTGVNCMMQVPQMSEEAHLSSVSDQKNDASVVLHPVDIGHYDYRYALRIEAKRMSTGDFNEMVRNYTRIVRQGDPSQRKDDLVEWRFVTDHKTLAHKELGTVILYRKNVYCADGDVIRISGAVEKVSDQATGKPLWPEFDVTLRKIVTSIRPAENEE